MRRKFIYGPGLPGYGTAGTDGSAGLTGLAVFFSAYDGNSDTVTIKGKIIANKELFSNDVLIPGYPSRVYQTGDIFIDKNARVFQIDFAESNLYKDTGIFLNTSGFFAEGPPQTLSPGFQRYSNAFETDKFLIDVVYTNLIGDYTQYPSSIYDNIATYFGRVSYIGDDVLPDLNGWYPFEVWTIGNNVTGNDAIALTRRGDKNEWHFGNLNDGSIRDASLYLDFNDIYCPSVAPSSSETNILYWNTSTGRIAQGPAPSGMTMSNYAADRVTTAGGSASNINAEANLTFNGSLLTVTGDASITGNLGLTGSLSSVIFSGSSTQTIKTLDRSASSVPKLSILGGNIISSGNYKGGSIEIKAGDSCIGSEGLPGGDVSIYAGRGGIGEGADSGRGGNLYIRSGDGGSSSTYEAGPGGLLFIIAGDGGWGGSEVGGMGGGITIRSGAGGSVSSGYAGPGGDINILSGGVGTIQSGGTTSKSGDINIFAADCPENHTPGSIYIRGGNYDGSWTANSGVVYIASTTSGAQRGRALFALGDATYPGIGFGGFPNTGFFGLAGPTRIGVTISGTEQFRFDVSTFHARGNIVAYSTTPSDIRLKTNIEDLDNSLDKVLKLRGVSYERLANKEKHIGYIAQEVEGVIPEVILETNLLGEDESILYKTVKYTELIPYLSEAIKSQQEIINKQQKTIDYLFEEIEKLKNKI